MADPDTPMAEAAPDAAPVPAAPDIATPEPAIGKRLRIARDRLGMSLIEVSERLHLDPLVIDSLETERYEMLGAPVYVRGHLRRYAEFLGESPELLLDRYASLQQSAETPDVRQAPRALPQSDPRRFLWPAVIIAGVCVLAGILWWALSAQPAP